MRRLTGAAVAAVVLALAGLAAAPAYAALVEVKIGNFYFDDATAGDAKVEAVVGDQVRFIVQDSGPGTPHTVEVDELGIHSGSLASGTTFTTPPLQQAGTYKLYCKPHERRGHVASLVVYNTDGSLPAAVTTTTTAAPTATTASPTATTAAPSAPAAAPAPGAPAPGAPAAPTTTPPPPTATPGAAPTPAPAPTPGDAPAADATPETAAEPTDTVPVGTGEATEAELEAAPVQPDSLEAALGRRPATRGPWTRSVRMALAALPVMLLAAGVAISRLNSTKDPELNPSE